MLRYVIFDMDGVIIDSEPMHARAAVNAIARFGVTVDIPYCYRFIGSTTRFMMETVISDFKMDVSAEELLAATEAEKVRLTLEEGYTEVPHVCALIRNLYAHGVKLAVASSSNPDEIEKAVSALQVKQCFERLVSGCTVAHPKPAPDVFLKAVEELHAKKEECLIIEDSMNGLLAAKAAGIPAIGFANPNSGRQDLSTAFMIVEGFDEVDYRFLSDAHSHFHGIPVTIASTDRFTIRELMPEDIREVFRIYENEEVSRYVEPLSDSLETEMEKQKAYAEQIYRFYGYGLWGMFKADTGELIGRCGIEQKTIDGEAEFEISYLLDRDYWGQGYGQQAVLTVLSYAAASLDTDRIVAVIDKQNSRSIQLVSCLGFHKEKNLIYQGRDCFLFVCSLAEMFKHKGNSSPATDSHRQKQKSVGAAVKRKYQEHPDTSVYGKRYS